MAGKITHNYRGEEVTVEEFCSICDHYPNCPSKKYDQERYVLRDWCGWARVGGVRVAVSKDEVLPDFDREGKKLPRDDKSKLIELLKAEGEQVAR